MTPEYQLLVQDIFRFRDGRAVFAGVVEGDPGYISRGPFEVLIDGEVRCGFEVEAEMLSDRVTKPGEVRLRSVSSTEVKCVDREFLKDHDFVLRPADPSTMPRGFVMHRHLLGVDSPPSQYVADPMTQGPILPEGWDGDAWIDPARPGYFLRAWHKQEGRVAYGRGITYEAARRALLEDVVKGVREVTISVRETVAG
jgi:hypothetical protein